MNKDNRRLNALAYTINILVKKEFLNMIAEKQCGTATNHE